MKSSILLGLVFPAFIFCLLSKTLESKHSNTSPTCVDLPPQCQYIKYIRHFESDGVETEDEYGNKTLLNEKGILCENIFDDKMLRALNATLRSCPHLQGYQTIISIKPNPKRLIVNDSFGVFRLSSDIPKHNYKSGYYLILNFLMIKGFDIESKIELKGENAFQLLFYYGFNLFKQNRLLKGCDGFERRSNTSQGFIFQARYFSGLEEFWIKKPQSVYPVCSLFFRNAKINALIFEFMVDSYFKKNVVSFSDPVSKPQGNNSNDTHKENDDDHDHNTHIIMLNIFNSYGLTLDSKFLNPNLFAQTSHFSFDCQISSIQNDAFRPLIKLYNIEFDPLVIFDLIRRQGKLNSIFTQKDIHMGKYYIISHKIFTQFTCTFDSLKIILRVYL